MDHQALFLEVVVDDSSDFETGRWRSAASIRHGYQILEVHGPVVPNTIASVLLHIRDVTGLMPHIYFRWTEGNPVTTCCGSCSSARARSPRSPARCCARPNRTSRRPWVHVG